MIGGISAGVAYVDLKPRVDSQAVQKEGESIGKTVAKGAAAYGLGRTILGSIQDAQESRKIMALTENAIRTTGQAANLTADDIANLSEQQAMLSGTDDELIQQSANLLLTFKAVRNEVGEGNNVFERAMIAGQDLAAQGIGSITSNAVQLGKALQDPVKGISALSRAGVQFTDQQKSQIAAMVESNDLLGAQKLILGEIEGQVGGAAAAAADPYERMQVTVGNLKEEFGEGFLPMVDAVSNGIAGMSPEARTATVRVAALGIAGAGAAIGIGKVSDGVRASIDGFKSASGAVSGWTDKVKASREAGSSLSSAISSSLNPSLIAGGVAVGIAALAYKAYADQKAEVTAATDRLIAAQEAEAAGTKGAVDDMLARDLAQRGLIESAREMGVSIEDMLAIAKGDPEALSRARAATDEYVESNRTLGVVTLGVANRQESFNEQINNLYDGAKGAESQTRQLADAEEVLEDQAAETTVKTMGLKRATDLMATAMDRAEGKAFDLEEATSAYEAALDAAREAGKGNNDTLDLSTERGRENAATLRDLVRSANDHTQAVFEETGSVKEAKDVAKQHREQLREVAGQLGATKGQTNDYIDTIKLVPRNVVSKFEADTSKARNAISELIDGWKSKEIELPLDVYLANVRGDGPGTLAFAGGNALDTVRKNMAGIPGLSITSTYRTPEHNAAIGGSPTSHHTDPNNPAVDIVGPMASLDALYARLQQIGGRELLWRTEGHWDHLHYAHTGGVVSQSWPTLPGLKADERPVVAQIGEEIITAEDRVRRAGGPLVHIDRYEAGGQDPMHVAAELAFYAGSR